MTTDLFSTAATPKREHIPNSSCWSEENAVEEEHWLPICIECGETCHEEGDELCHACFNTGTEEYLNEGPR